MTFIYLILGILLGFIIGHNNHARRDYKKSLNSVFIHQLRAPLTNIKIIFESIADNNKENLGELLKRGLKETVVALQMTKEILTNQSLSNYDKDKKEFSEIDILELINELVQNNSLAAQKKSLTFSVTGPSMRIKGYRPKLAIAIQNLIDNAIHYSNPNGQIKITITNEDKLRVKIKDSGIGIPKKEQGGLFKRLFRATNARKQEDGTGMGLYIAKKMIDLHHGSIDVQSEEGLGSEFTITLPIYK